MGWGCKVPLERGGWITVCGGKYRNRSGRMVYAECDACKELRGRTPIWIMGEGKDYEFVTGRSVMERYEYRKKLEEESVLRLEQLANES